MTEQEHATLRACLQRLGCTPQHIVAAVGAAAAGRKRGDVIQALNQWKEKLPKAV